MNRLLLLLLLSGTLPAIAQDSNNPVTPIRIGVGAGFGLRALNNKPNVQNFGSDVLTYLGRPPHSNDGTLSVVDDLGRTIEAKYTEYNAEGFIRLLIAGRKENGWSLSAGYAFARSSYAYATAPALFQGRTFNRFYSDLESHAIQFGVGYFWNKVWFAKTSGLYFQEFTIGGLNKSVSQNILYNYTENGSGYLIDIVGRGANKFALVPEIGFMWDQHPVELSISAVIPLGDYAYAERYSLYQNRRLAGEGIATYSTSTASLNLRVGFTIFNSKVQPKRASKPSSAPVYSQPVSTQPAPPTDSHVHYDALPPKTPSRFDRQPLNRPIRLLVHFKQSEAMLLPESVPDLNELARWMAANPTAEIRLEGHTDLIGGATENMDLSKRRVVAVKDYLSSQRVASLRVETGWFGDTRPLDRNCMPPCTENRRVELVITKR